MGKNQQTPFLYVIVIRLLIALTITTRRIKPKKAAGYRQPSSEKEKDEFVFYLNYRYYKANGVPRTPNLLFKKSTYCFN
jgi:hypothetical protein